MTSKDEELREQRRWVLRPDWAKERIFDALLHNEFLPAAVQEEQQSRALAKIVAFAASEVPWYRRLFECRGIDVGQVRRPGDLVALPILTKRDVIESFDSLRAEQLPAGEKVCGIAKSSGTTGQPVSVLITRQHNSMFSILWQRQARWFRLDPSAMFCDIRGRRDIGDQPDRSPHLDGVVRRWPHWRYLGICFETGPEIGFNRSNDIEQQVEWLKEYRPAYLMCDPGLMEELALADGARSPSPALRGLLAISSQLTESLRAQLQRFYGVPIHQTYGLNEIGKVGVRCEAGRYHVHSEHCLVEIVDENGLACRPGQMGRVVVTGFRNHAMPLIRYDTGDLARAVGGPCACGRTLPSFGEIAGRYRRYAGLPPATPDRVRVIQRAFSCCPPEELAFLRQYQIHQHRDQHFELCLRTVEPIPESFRRRFLAAWVDAGIEPAVPLEITQVATVVRSPSGKVLDFTSDLYPDESSGPQNQDCLRED